MPIDAPIHTSENNLPRVLGAGLPVGLVFWQRECAPCEQLMPVLDQLAKRFAGRALLVKVNVADEPGLAGKYQIEALPSIVFVKDGRTVATARGAAGESELAAWLEYLTRGGTQPAVPSGPSMVLARSGAAAAQGDGHGARAGAPAGAPAGAAAGAAAAGGQPVVLSDANFDQMVRSSKVPVLVDFWAVWCGPCRMVAPVVEQLAKEYNGRALVGKLNVDENPVISQRYEIMSIPTLLIFRNGQIVDRIIGAQPANVLRGRLAAQVR